MVSDFVPPRPSAHPMIYAYADTNPQYAGLLKVGYTAIDVDKRVAQQYPAKRPGGTVPYRIVYRASAMYPDGSSFTDHDVHRALKRRRIPAVGGEWFRCTADDVAAAVLSVRSLTDNAENRTASFSMRPEQQAAVEKTENYFRSLFAVGFQGLLILVCVAIYAVLIQSIATDGDPIGAIWGCVGYTVLLCFTLFKTGSLAKSIFGCH